MFLEDKVWVKKNRQENNIRQESPFASALLSHRYRNTRDRTDLKDQDYEYRCKSIQACK